MMRYTLILFLLGGLFSCAEEAARSDAYGNFEATVTTVSAEAAGRLLYLRLEEGDRLEAGALVGLVDTTALALQRRQVLAQIGSVGKQTRTADPNVRVLEDQRRNLVRERDRTRRLVEAKAATPRQLDELNGQIEVVDQQINAARRETAVANRGILAGRDPLRAQLPILDDKIARSYVRNPVAGTVLTKMAEPSEIVGLGTPLYRVGRLDTLTLRAYAGAVELQRTAVGKEVEVLIDAGEEAYRALPGRITWIADQAEFTPKTIQTKEERTTLVYAIKVAVPNPGGRLKLGMPAEVNFGGAAAGAGGLGDPAAPGGMKESKDDAPQTSLK